MSRRVLFIVAGLVMCQALWAQKFQVETNAVGWLTFGTVNFQLDYALSRHWTMGVGGKYNPFTLDKDGGESQMQLKQRSAALFGRWWPWHVYSGWWVSGKMQWQEYNMGGIISKRTEEGNRFGAGLSAGYTHMISTHWNMEFGLGFWGGLKKYTVYECPTCGMRVKEGTTTFIMPNDLIIAVGYVF